MDGVTCLVAGPLRVRVEEGRPVSLAILDVFAIIARNRWAPGESREFESDMAGLLQI